MPASPGDPRWRSSAAGFVLSNNGSYASIRIQQERDFPGRAVGTSLFNPDFVAVARAYGMRARLLSQADEIDDAIREGLASREPCFIEVKTSLSAVLPARAKAIDTKRTD